MTVLFLQEENYLLKLILQSLFLKEHMLELVRFSISRYSFIYCLFVYLFVNYCYIPCLIVAPRSGLALKHSIDTGAGVIDYDYRGPVGVILFNHADTEFIIKKGDRVAQLILERISMAGIQEVAELSSTERGTGGFGSTGILHYYFLHILMLYIMLVFIIVNRLYIYRCKAASRHHLYHTLYHY